jgi:hypothetical protein
MPFPRSGFMVTLALIGVSASAVAQTNQAPPPAYQPVPAAPHWR